MNIPWQILICLGKKGIGKTYEIMMLLNRAVLEGFKVVYVRNTVKDATSALERQLNDDDRSAVRVKSRGMGIFDLEAKYEKDDLGKPIKVGYFASITSLTCMQGGSYDGVRYIIWDECINDDKNVKLVPAQVYAFERFMSSVVRKKKDCKVLIFGNLLKKETEVVGDTLLDHYGINTSCDCKYIPDPEVKHSGLLFINTKSMFQGIEKQGLLLGVDKDRNDALLSNDPEFNDYKVCGMPFYLECEPYMSLLFTYNTEEIKLSIRKFE